MTLLPPFYPKCHWCGLASSTKLFRFSLSNIEKLGGAWRWGYLNTTCIFLLLHIQYKSYMYSWCYVHGNNVDFSLCNLFTYRTVHFRNLQAAVGAYYDFYGQSNLQPPQVCVVKDYPIAEGAPLLPMTPFTKTWRLKNPGTCTCRNIH